MNGADRSFPKECRSSHEGKSLLARINPWCWENTRDSTRRFLNDSRNNRAARLKNLDAMVEASGTVSDVRACHEVYRDKDDPKDRCIP
jgi:cytochrome c556